jgi:hypothetical protein
MVSASLEIVFVDVDDTLVRSAGSKRMPISAVVDRVRALKQAAATLYCWSSGGAGYARDSAREVGLEDCFVSLLPKPTLMIDDQPLSGGSADACTRSTWRASIPNRERLAVAAVMYHSGAATPNPTVTLRGKTEGPERARQPGVELRPFGAAAAKLVIRPRGDSLRARSRCTLA